jgi:tRNA-dihydrouridine synthase 1
MEKAKVLGWEPPAIDATTGYRSLPVWAAQPLIRLLPVSSEVGGNDELVNEEIGAAPGSESSNPTFGFPLLLNTMSRIRGGYEPS